jgi:hypothetical protein
MKIIHTSLIAAWALLFFFVFSSSVFAQQDDINAIRYIFASKRVGEAINKGDIGALENEFNATMKAELPPEKIKPLIYQMTEQLGKIKQMGKPKMKWKDIAIIAVEFDSGLLDMRLSLDSTDKISGLYFQPHVIELPVPVKNTTHLSLPLKGEWAVMWGGDTKEQNYHHDIKNQRYAFDFNVLQGFGKSHKTDGKTNEDYFAFGQEILAPADGRVTEVIDGVRDNVPFSPNEYSAVGNCVIIQHSQYECSVLAHLKRGSTRVKPGDSVSRGQVIGLCGNSGNSSEPHLHYHLQNTPILQDATGIKVYFDNVSVRRKDDEHKEKLYSPVRDDKVKNE